MEDRRRYYDDDGKTSFGQTTEQTRNDMTLLGNLVELTKSHQNVLFKQEGIRFS